MALVEGKTELLFAQSILAPHLAERGIDFAPIILGKGGDVRFQRAVHDMGAHFKQRPDTYLTLIVDYYGIHPGWPGVQAAKGKSTPAQKAEAVNRATYDEVVHRFGEWRADRRFIPYVSMHELEALWFSDPPVLAEKLGILTSRVDAVLSQCGEPENINDSPETAPSKRLERWSGYFSKTRTGIAIARSTGLEKMRARCPIFDAWVTRIEGLKGLASGGSAAAGR